MFGQYGCFLQLPALLPMTVSKITPGDIETCRTPSLIYPVTCETVYIVIIKQNKTTINAMKRNVITLH